MESQHSLTSVLPWIWATEVLASMKHVDVSLLIDLVEKLPRLPDNIDRNARELVFLRVLESIYDQYTPSNPGLSGSSPKIGFNKMEKCETVVGRIVNELSSQNFEASGGEISKWDIQPFVAHKRSCLTSCSLQKLKDSILAGYHPSLVSLRERSGLQVPSENEKDKCTSSKNDVKCRDTDRPKIVNIHSSNDVKRRDTDRPKIVNIHSSLDEEEDDISADPSCYGDDVHRRRKARRWATIEEEKLKEAMLAMCRPDDKVIPWKKILEFGADTFQDRTTVDLKDKWRNVCKAIRKFNRSNRRHASADAK